MITEDYVSLEIAKLLKEKGFDEPCLYHYIEKNSIRTHNIDWKMFRNSQLLDCYNAPTASFAMKWLREKHNIGICLLMNDMTEWYSYIRNTKTGEHLGEIYYLKTYELAVEAAIRYCLKNLL